LPPGLCPGPRWGSLQCYPIPLAGFKGPTSKEGEGRGGKEKKGEGKEGRGREKRRRREGEGRGRRGCPPPNGNSWICA